MMENRFFTSPNRISQKFALSEKSKKMTAINDNHFMSRQEQLLGFYSRQSPAKRV